MTQHYRCCFVYNLGADGDGDHIDGRLGPHAATGLLGQLGLSRDVSEISGSYSKVKRITRYVRW